MQNSEHETNLMIDRRLVQCFDWGMLGLTLLLAGVGVLTIYSAVTAGLPVPERMIYIKQLVWFGVGFFLMIVTFLFDYKKLDQWVFAIYAGSILLLVCVLIFGKHIGGARRWLALGPISVQPSEMVKIALIIILSRQYAKTATKKGLTLRELILPILLTAVPFVLIVKQPDLGTALLLVLIAGSITLFVKIERKSLLCIMGTGLISVPLVWSLLKGYQKQRILTFLDPERDPLGAGYHIIQSKIAIGSGMITGKGFLKGTQNTLSFLPEQHTDFIFSVFAEEWGFVGSAVLILILLVFIVWGLNIAYGCRDPFGIILAFGITTLIFWQVFINIGMVMGLMPVVGIPLPFISYGGSSIITMMLGVGLLMNVSMRRFQLE